jgi:hypothetical protein
MKLKDYQKLKKQYKDAASTEPQIKAAAAAKQSGEKLQTALKTADTVLKPVED